MINKEELEVNFTIELDYNKKETKAEILEFLKGLKIIHLEIKEK